MLLTAIFPPAPEMFEVRLSQVPVESLSTLAVTPALEELIAEARLASLVLPADL